MDTPRSLRAIAKQALGRRGIEFVRRCLHKTTPAERIQRNLAGKSAFEIGGPSEIFGDAGPLPIYSILGSC
jgi:hypothetical protein